MVELDAEVVAGHASGEDGLVRLAAASDGRADRAEVAANSFVDGEAHGSEPPVEDQQPKHPFALCVALLNERHTIRR